LLYVLRLRSGKWLQHQVIKKTVSPAEKA